jgi:hypothetical protein
MTGYQDQAIEFAERLLSTFVVTAGRMGLQPRSVDPTSKAAYATGIALAKWPRDSQGNLTYFPIVVDGGYADILWLGGESQGLSVTPRGEFFLSGDSVGARAAGAWLARVCGYATDAIESAVTVALSGSPSTVR